jgi:transcriptional regulator with XRE-family HTH domain
MPAILRAAVPAGNSREGIARTCQDRLQLDCVDFPHALKERRASRRLSQLELALRAGTTQRHLSFIESGRSVPGREMVVRLAESLGLPLRERNQLLLQAELRLMTTISSFANAVDVTISELKLEAFLPADQATSAALTREAEACA